MRENISKIRLNQPLMTRKSPKKYMGSTEADVEYAKGLMSGLDSVTAAKQAQLKTGLSLLTGRPMKNRGFNGGTSVQ